ncbi:MAG TPA: hypothetical protein VN618_04300 [Solirubrobacteraceae bacterium]|nr:hypothetical protein [Solirubrobacteraceae bacterium]
MAPQDDADAPRRGAPIALTLLAVVLGGLLGWTAVFVGLGWPGLIVGLAVTLVCLGAVARRLGSKPLLASYGLAFTLLTWPLLWLPVGFVRYLMTGETLGN